MDLLATVGLVEPCSLHDRLVRALQITQWAWQRLVAYTVGLLEPCRSHGGLGRALQITHQAWQRLVAYTVGLLEPCSLNNGLSRSLLLAQRVTCCTWDLGVMPCCKLGMGVMLCCTFVPYIRCSLGLQKYLCGAWNWSRRSFTLVLPISAPYT